MGEGGIQPASWPCSLLAATWGWLPPFTKGCGLRDPLHISVTAPPLVLQATPAVALGVSFCT